MATTEVRMFPVMASISPKLKVPPTVASFSITSKKLKNDVWSVVLGSIFEYVERANDCEPPITKPMKNATVINPNAPVIKYAQTQTNTHQNTVIIRV